MQLEGLSFAIFVALRRFLQWVLSLIDGYDNNLSREYVYAKIVFNITAISLITVSIASCPACEPLLVRPAFSDKFLMLTFCYFVG